MKEYQELCAEQWNDGGCDLQWRNYLAQIWKDGNYGSRQDSVNILDILFSYII